MGYYIGMDVGGTYARIKLADQDGRILYTSTGEGGALHAAGYETVRDRLHRLLVSALRACGLRPAQCASLVIGASGIDSPELKEQMICLLVEAGFSPAVIHAYNDCEMLLAVFDHPAIALVAGTGAIATGRVSSAQPVLRSGGWNYLISDEGSAVSIAFSALRSLLKHWDGQISCPLLASEFERAYHITTPEALIGWFLANQSKKDRMAAIAPLVDAAAAQGDPVAENILRDAANSLCSLVDCLARRMDLVSHSFSLLLWGSVLLNNHTVRSCVCEHMARHYPRSLVLTLSSSALDCALSLACGASMLGLTIPIDDYEKKLFAV